MKVSAKLSTVLYAGCPNCGNARAFCLHEQILKQKYFSGWSCDQCDHCYDGKLENGAWTLTHKGVNQPTLVLLALPPQQKPVYFVIENKVYARHGDPLGSAEREKHNRFFYEEHTCPTNVVRCEAILNQDADRPGEYVGDDHGVFNYVGEIHRDLLKGGENPDSVDYIVGFSHLVPDLRHTAVELGILEETPTLN